jgi:diguanylate cyclase (GGDEF)-like protein
LVARGVLVVFSVVVATALTGHVLWAQFGLGRGNYDWLLGHWLYNCGLLAAAGIPLVQMLRRPGRRAVYGAIGLAILVWALGNIYWSAALQHLESPPFPSPADLGYLLFYPAAYIGVMLIIRGRVGRFLPSVWLDGLIVAFSCAALGVALLIDPIMSGIGGTFAQVATNLAYPIGDLILIAMVVLMVAFSGWRFDLQAALLTAGLVTFAVADSIYVERVASGTYVQGSILDSMWIAGLALLACSCLFDSKVEPRRRQDGWAVVVAPAACALVALGLVVYSALAEVSAAVPLLAVGALLVTFIRAGLTYRDVQALADARRQARTDELTGLPNRRWLIDLLKRRIELGEVAALTIFDLNGFKEINDTLGHHAGDAVLKQVAECISNASEGLGLAARLGGDEFAIVTDGLPQAAECAKRIHVGLAEGFPLGDLTLSLSAALGTAGAPEHATDSTSLLRCADVALYHAKRGRIPTAVYSPGEDRHSLDNLMLTSDLRAAIANEDLSLVYQPKISLATGALVGVEALARWEHPRRGAVPPVEFVQLAEAGGLMPALTGFVLRTALAQASIWLAEGEEIPVAVNVSATDLIDSGFPDTVAVLLKAHNVPPRLLQIEITETELVRDSERTAATITRLSKLGVRVALDDFGRGYSSLQYLQHLAVHEMKIDKAFVLNMTDRATDAAIVRCAIDMAQALNLHVVGEGVEDEAAYRMLQSFGCDYAQGFGIATPLSPPALRQWIDAWKSADAPSFTGTARALH